VLICAACFWATPSELCAADLLVVDRLSNSVYRYDGDGALLGTVVDNSADLNQPTGIGISPDFTELYVSSSQNNRVMKYDYDAATGVATNATVFADAADGLAFPNDIQFSPNHNRIYVANLDGGVSQFNTDGSSAGAKLMLPTSVEGVETPTSSMNFLPDGRLLAGAFQDASGAGGGVAVSNSDVSGFSGYFVQPMSAITGATGLMIHDGYLYVSGLLRTNIRRFSMSNGQIDSSWGISGVGFPQDLVEAPDGNGFLAGILGFGAGGGNIFRYSFDGTPLGAFPLPSSERFTEATAFVVVPDPPIGDFNGNGVVDAADYVVWRNASPTDTLPNDNTPGTVDATDYGNWRANFGKTGPASAASPGPGAAPEPASVLLISIAVLAGALVRNRN
jgi:sugar lactone lactonase YvrE